jgi:hypothetical protein
LKKVTEELDEAEEIVSDGQAEGRMSHADRSDCANGDRTAVDASVNQAKLSGPIVYLQARFGKDQADSGESREQM